MVTAKVVVTKTTITLAGGRQNDDGWRTADGADDDDGSDGNEGGTKGKDGGEGGTPTLYYRLVDGARFGLPRT